MRLDEQAKQRVLAYNHQGLHYTEIATLENMHRNTIYMFLKYKARQPMIQHKKGRKPMTTLPESWAKMRQLRENGETYAAIGARFGVTRQRVHQIVNHPRNRG